MAAADVYQSRLRSAATAMRYPMWLTAFLCTLTLGACRDRVNLHPLTDHLRRPPIAPTVITSIAESGSPLPPSVVAALHDANGHISSSISIGVLDAPLSFQFGSIVDASVDRAGNLVVLDGQAAQLRVFAIGDGTSRSTPEALQVLGGPGLGPGEFQRPRAMSLGYDGLVGVFELHGRVHLFETNSRKLIHLNTLQLPMTIEDACILGSELIVTGRHSDHPESIHVFTTTGEWVRSFGQIYDSPRTQINNTLNRSKVACLESSGQILSAPVFVPEVRKYDMRGELLWWTTIKELLPLYIAETSNGRVTMGTPPDGYHTTVNIVADHVMGVGIVQIAFVTREFVETGNGGELLTYALDLESGAGTLMGDGYRGVRDLYAGGAVLSTILPFPTLKIVSW